MGYVKNIKNTLHKIDGLHPRSTIYYNDDDEIHRENIHGPALKTYDHYGDLIEEMYFINGIIHRDDGPAVINYHFHEIPGLITYEYYQNGVLHRDDGPSFLWFKNGSLISKSYHQNGELHHESGPAMIHYKNEYTDENENIEIYYNNGIIHREGGPAVINHDLNIKEYYLEGNLIEPDKVPFDLNKELTDEEKSYLKLKFG